MNPFDIIAIAFLRVKIAKKALHLLEIAKP